MDDPEEAKRALLADADGTVSRLRAWRDECRTGGQVAQARLLEEEWAGTQSLLQRVMDVWRADAAAAAASDADASPAVVLEEAERAALRRVAGAGLQLMANLTAGYPEGAARVFEALVPTSWGLEILETLSRERALVACVLVALHNRLALASSSEGAGGGEERAEAAAADALVAARALLCKLTRIALPPPPPTPTTTPTPDAQDEKDDPVLEWTYLLLLQLLRVGKGAGVFEACGVRLPARAAVDEEEEEEMHVLFTPEQLVLLHLLEEAVDDRHAHEEGGGSATTHVLVAADEGELCGALAGRIVRAAGWLDREGGGAGVADADVALLAAGAAAAVRVVGGMLAHVDWAESGRREALVAQGLVGALLRLLRREGGAADGSIPREDGDVAAAEGRKAELVRALGNLCHGCRAAQDAVRLFDSDDADEKSGSSSIGGLGLVLSHCNVDSRNPYLREWALLAVRHLCEGNDENQRAIAALRPQAAVQTEGLTAAGVEARLVGEGEGRARVAVRRVGGGGGDGDTGGTG